MAKARVLFMALVLMFSLSSHAGGEESGPQRFMQGVVSSIDLGSFVLNEGQTVNIDEATQYYDINGRASGIQVIAERRWLYVEGKVEPDNSVTAEKVYALPGHVGKKNRSRYEFMQLP